MTAPSGDPAGRPKVLYVIGTQRGGTTIGGRLISVLPGFAFVGELRKLWQVGLPEGRSCGCGRSYENCPVWSVVLPRVIEGADVGALQALQEAAAPDRRSSRRAFRLSRRRDLSDDPAAAGYSALLAATYRALAESLGARVLVDTSKLPADAVLVSRLPDIDAYFLQLVRDPRGTAQSVIRRDGSAGRHVRLALSVAAGWSVRHAVARAAVRRAAGAGRHLVVRYEDLVAAPGAVLGEIANFVGEPRAAENLAVGAAVSLDVAHTPIGGGRFASAEVELAVDDRWMSAMNATDRRLVTAVSWPVARGLGYGKAKPGPGGGETS